MQLIGAETPPGRWTAWPARPYPGMTGLCRDDPPAATFSSCRLGSGCAMGASAAMGADARLPRLVPRRLSESFENRSWSGEVFTFRPELRKAALIAGLPTG